MKPDRKAQMQAVTAAMQSAMQEAARLERVAWFRNIYEECHKELHQPQPTMTPFKFEIEISTEDYRNCFALEESKRTLSYLMKITSGHQHCAYCSQPLEEDEVGTRESYFNMMDVLRMKILEKLSPTEEPPQQP